MATATFADSQEAYGNTSLSPYAIVKGLGSLKITVAMFALAILVVLFGTLAQDETDLAGVKREYFNCWIAYVQFDVLFPITILPHAKPVLGGTGFYFPGGATIGLILLVNLIAAKATRFGVKAKGGRLAAGIILSAVGAGLITLVIVSGHATNGLQGKPPIAYDTIWLWMKLGCGAIALALIGYASLGKMPLLARILTAITAAVAVSVAFTLLLGGESVRLDNPGLRIVWQLLQASIASIVLLVGLNLVFRHRGGNVLIHIAVGLLMVGQFVFGDRQVEQRIGLAEGTKTNLAVIEDQIEIALIDTSDSEEDVVYAIPESMIRRYGNTEEIIDEDALPCKVRILKFFKNSTQAPIGSEPNLATTGWGLQMRAVSRPPIGGAVMDDTNIAAAYLELIDRESDQPLGTYLLTQDRNDRGQMFAGLMSDQRETAEIDGRSFEMAIRYRQERKPYDVYLKDVERINYSGSATARDYSSVIVITDRETGVSQEDKAWMNNPIRYRGETFYQSRYNKIPISDERTIETTGLQVVANAGWVIPYVCCMMAFWGMAAHFGGTFLRFAKRFERERRENSTKRKNFNERLVYAGIGILLPAIIGLSSARSRGYPASSVDWDAVASFPVQHEGRIKAFDTVARNLLQQLAEPIFGATPRVTDKDGVKHNANEWLLGVMAGKDWVKEAEIFRIYSPSVKNFMDLDPNRENSRYSLSELEPNLAKLSQEVRGYRNQELNFVQQKLAKLNGKINLYSLISYSYSDPPVPSLDVGQEKFNQSIMQIFEVMQQLESGRPPAMIPPAGEATKESMVDATWQAYGPARFKEILGILMRMEDETRNESVDAFAEILNAHRQDDTRALNKAIRDYGSQLAATPLAEPSLPRVSAEKWLNNFNATGQGVGLYVLAIVLGFAGFIIRIDGLRSATFWLLVGALVIHTIAILSRIYISGRAPVINLYSASVFIGWACVLAGLVFEAIFPRGVANLTAGLIGALSLSVARFLDSGDTMPVLQAVLDTQFWLSTHVVTVTLGYSATYLAGVIGICMVVHRIYTGYDRKSAQERPQESKQLQRDMYGMCYGAICFGIFFSFVGTVLGGLWADDSWGRFWGWDPKE
ncbi:MAG: cytochrome c biogenesis protein CcsA, partial [Planctomycetota bacterium]